MPRQTIQYPNTERDSGVELSVHWGQESSVVQIAATRHIWRDPHAEQDRHTHSDHSHCSACPPVPDARMALLPEGMKAVREAEAESPATVWSEPLTRHQINDMIKTLRRARDSVFGADA